MKKLYSWEISDAFWEKVKAFIPVKPRNPRRKYRRKRGGGRKPIEARKVLEGIVFVLRTGIQWKALPKEKFGCPSAIHRYFLEWSAAGFFLKIWQAGLMEYDEMEGIAWEWQSIDGALTKSPLAMESVGANPTDRGKKWNEKKFARRRAWRPAIPYRQRSERSRREIAGFHA